MIRQPGNPGNINLSNGYDDKKAIWNIISHIDLLTTQEETSLAKQNEAGIYAAHVLESDDTLNPSDREEYQQIVLDGLEAWDTLIKANLRAVYWTVVKNFTIRPPLHFGDLFDWGCAGLIEAANLFDYTKGYRLRTYANNNINGRISRGLIEEARTIKLPEKVAGQVRALNKAKDHIWSDTGHEPDLYALAEALECSVEDVAELLRAVGIQPVSLNVPIDENGETTLIDLIEGPGGIAPEDSLDGQYGPFWCIASWAKLPESSQRSVFWYKDPQATIFHEMARLRRAGIEQDDAINRVKTAHPEIKDDGVARKWKEGKIMAMKIAYIVGALTPVGAFKNARALDDRIAELDKAFNHEIKGPDLSILNLASIVGDDTEWGGLRVRSARWEAFLQQPPNKLIKDTVKLVQDASSTLHVSATEVLHKSESVVARRLHRIDPECVYCPHCPTHVDPT